MSTNSTLPSPVSESEAANPVAIVVTPAPRLALVTATSFGLRVKPLVSKWTTIRSRNASRKTPARAWLALHGAISRLPFFPDDSPLLVSIAAPSVFLIRNWRRLAMAAAAVPAEHLGMERNSGIFNLFSISVGLFYGNQTPKPYQSKTPARRSLLKIPPASSIPTIFRRFCIGWGWRCRLFESC